MEYSIEDDVPKGHQERSERTVGRRQLLKVLIAAGGAITTSAVLSNRWVRPIVEVGVLPAHAHANAHLQKYMLHSDGVFHPDADHSLPDDTAASHYPAVSYHTEVPPVAAGTIAR